MDGDVDSLDRTTLATYWTGALPPGVGDRTTTQGDCDGDGDVDVADQTSTIQNWTGAMAGNIGNGNRIELVDYLRVAEHIGPLVEERELIGHAVPEPTGCVLLVLGALVLGRIILGQPRLRGTVS